MRKTVLVQAIACAILSGAAHAAVKVEDKTFNTAANMLAYTEFELSGEPLAEALGLDLDVLDANRADEPTPFDFAAGIESYEYSEEAMYALNYQSGMGPIWLTVRKTRLAAAPWPPSASGCWPWPMRSASRR